MIIVGIILLIVALIVFLYSTFSTKSRLEQLTNAGKQKLHEILETYRQTKKELGDIGDGDESIADEALTVRGKISCDNPLEAPLSKRPCIYYSMKIVSEYRTRDREQDSDGHWRTVTHTHTDTLEDSSQSIPFTIDDGTDSVLVDATENGTFEGTQTVVDRAEIRSPNAGASISFGGFSLKLGNSGPRDNETIKYHEEIMTANQTVTVIGSMTDKRGELQISNGKNGNVIVSTKSAAEMLADTKSTIKAQNIAVAICGGLGLVLFIIGLL